MRNAQKSCWIVAGICIVLTIVFCFSSSSGVDRQTAAVLGSDRVINFQGTLFTCAFAIASVISIIGAFIAGGLAEAEEERENDLDKVVSILQASLAKEPESFGKTEKTATPHQEVEPEKTVTTAQKPVNLSEKQKYESKDPEWKKSEDGEFIFCPECGTKVTPYYANVRHACPKCGRKYNYTGQG